MSSEELKDKKIDVLNHGFVKLIDWMGSDERICNAARTSYGGGTNDPEKDKNLIRYMMKHRHTSPFEMGEVVFHIKLPIFVMRQHIRHRTANVNEASARYSILPEEFYIPEFEDLQPQSKTNNQGREGKISDNQKQNIVNMMEDHTTASYKKYMMLIGKDISQDQDIGMVFDEEYPGLTLELARSVLPVSIYTECYWKIDLHNLFHYLKLRMDPHAQKEIRVYANAMYDLIKPLFPTSVEAFDDYIRNAHTVSSMEFEILRTIIQTYISKREHEFFVREMVAQNEKMGKRETSDFLKKWVDPK